MALITATQAALKLKYTPEHVRRLIRDGVIKAKRIGNEYIIDSDDIKGIKRKRSPNGTRKKKK
jgi:excisionase family DNA binding protein